MGLAADLVKFFAERKGSVEQFAEEQKWSNQEQFRASMACHRLLERGYIVRDSVTYSGYQTYSARAYDEDDADYGVYDFVAFGFAFVRDHFKGCVHPVIVKKQDGMDDIGSGFLLEDGWFVTAAHCVEKMPNIRLPKLALNDVLLPKLFASADKRVDLAAFKLPRELCTDVAAFKLGGPSILDEVLVMGFPPIPGFESVQVAELAQVAGFLQSSTGEVIAEEKAYLDQQRYLLFTARVKGGSSGGPVINIQGKVIGVVAQLPSGQGGFRDTLGYGVATPSTTLNAFLKQCDADADSVHEVALRRTDTGVASR